MKAKLIKTGNNFLLKDINSQTLAITSGTMEGRMLSLKNCQAIERGYDLDELAKIEYPICEVWNDEEALIRELAFKKGFKKALELLGDKKFSEEDMKSFARNYYREIRENTSNQLWDDLADKCMKEIIKSLQQTEWDVEIKMVKEHIGSGCYKKYPKSDDEGCLILKKYKNG